MLGIRKMLKDEEAAGILGCIGAGTFCGVGSGIVGVIAAIIGSFVANILSIGGLTALAGAATCVGGPCTLFGIGPAFAACLFSTGAPIWTLFCVPATAVLGAIGGLLGTAVGAFPGCLGGIFADWMATCNVIAATCDQAIGRSVQGIAGMMNK